ncbi:MAG: nuclear transport factor 2 family protein [Clostridium sp.]|uniref:nuclear transport factor 2 family protein n=1 Tax=Clostridium sp. TaxID=1506 RepID=UPI0025C26F3B|nr:nuclear transport factor 2 family protein [Clostridium sp.]MCF0147244.1 nuclear transport factor 2 family protein [Clostridium sp.]
MEEFIREFWSSVVAQDKDNLRKYFWEDAIIRWHCTNESFNLNEYIIANCEYPGNWSCEIERLIEVENNIITVARVYSEEMSCHATSFFKIENNKIKELNEYFGDDDFPPKWRLDKKLGKPIK